jgi:predicted transcriptional regulator
LSSKELTLKGEEALKVARALSSKTGFQILQLLSKDKLDISTIARLLKLSEPHISEAIKAFEDLRLINISYAPGKRGIKKMCELAVEKVTIVLRAPMS